MPAMLMQHDTDPKIDLFDKIGAIDDVEIFNNQLLCAIYVRPNQTKSGLYLADSTREEDKSQGKVALVVKRGPNAFVDDPNWKFGGLDVVEGDWVYFRASDGWAISINGVPCRILTDTSVRGRVARPDSVW